MPDVKFYFAWIDQGEAFDPDVHNREDEDVFSFNFSQREGDFASLELVIKNPRIGFLNPGRKVWAWFSASVDGAPAEPWMLGRLLGIPANVFDTLVTISLTARPIDFAEQKAALAETLKVAPFWDDIFISPDRWDDPDTVLEARTQLWHIDPVTHIVTVSDIIVPEDGVVEFGATGFFYESMSMTLNQIPARNIQITANIPWTQDAAGVVDVSRKFWENWPGSIGDGLRMISSFTFKGLLGSWPQQGARIGSGWTVRSGELKDVSYTSAREVNIPYYYDTSNIPALPQGSIMYPQRVTQGKTWGGVDGAGFDISVQTVFAPIGWGVPRMLAEYKASRKFVETLVINLKTSQQALVTLPGDDEAILLKLNANEVTNLDENNAMPLGNTLKRSFVDTERGRAAVEHVIALGRANLAARSRSVVTAFVTDMLSGKAVNLRKGIKINDPRIPGGNAVGKCTAYSFTLDGNEGEPLATLTLASCVGYGGSYTGELGDPIYCEADYVGSDYQEYENVVVLLGTEDVTYTAPPIAYFDDGIDFERGISADIAVKYVFVDNGPVAQRAAIESNPGVDTADVQAILQAIPTRVHLKMLPMEGGPFTATKEITVSELIIPKQIDLEAPSA